MVRVVFYKETDFKETSIGKIPEEWKIVRLENLGDIVNGFGFPIRYQGNKHEKYIFTKVSDTNLPGNEKFLTATENTIDDDLAEQMNARIYPPGTIIFPKIGMVIYLRKVRILARPGTFDNNIMGVVPNEGITNTEFLYYYFLGRVDLTKLAGRTTAPSIRKSDVANQNIALPSICEQKKIAAVLSVVDLAIQKTDEVIAKTEHLKKGLMQELLTKGIEHKEFKDTKLGRIPNQWQVVGLRDVSEIKRGPFGGSIKKEIFVSKGFKVYEQKNVIHNDFSQGNYYIDEVKFDEMRTFAIKEGDVLLTAAGTIGKTAIVPKHFEPGIINQALIKITLDKNKILIPYFNYLFNHEKYREMVLGSSHGATMKNISSVRNLGSMKIPLPPVKEQRKIVSILSVADRKLELERNEKAKLERIKRVLMDLLLTGKIRIRVS